MEKNLENLPVRSLRKTVLAFNMGWNSLTGVGIMASNYVLPKVAIDLGAGLSSEGIKIAGRARYLFSHKNFTMFLGMGVLDGMGTNGTSFQVTLNGETCNIELLNSPFLQISGGFEYLSDKGFFVMFDLGYAALLTKDNVKFDSCNPSDDMRSLAKFVYGSGLVIEFGIGYAF